MEEIILVSKEEFLSSPNPNYKDITEFLTGHSKHNINLKNIINRYPNLQKITFSNLSRDVAEHLIIKDVNYPNIKVQLKDCELASILIRKTSIKELNIQGPSEEIEKDRYHSEGIRIIQDVKIEILWISLTANIESISISGIDTSIGKLGLISVYNLKKIYVNAIINSFRFDNGISLENDVFLTNQIQTINLIRSQIDNLELNNIRFSNFYDGAESLMFENESDYQGQSASINNIKISNSKFPLNFKLTSNLTNLENAFFAKCTFKSLTINHKKANIKIDDCRIEEKITIGSESTEANSSKFEITNNTVDKGVFFGKHHIKDEFKIEGNRLENGKWKFYGFSLGANCKSEITDQSFDDVTFQNCDFSNFDFQNTDIHLAEIIEPTWNEIDDFTYLGRCSKKANLCKLQRCICWLFRFFNRSNLDNQKRISFERDNEFYKEKDIEKLKKQYSYFRKKFENQNSYEVSSKFKISEALTRIKLLKAKKSSRQSLLKISKWLNLFGESIARPIYCYLILLLVFCFIYTFTGFCIDDEPMRYQWQFPNIQNAIKLNCSDLENLFHALIFSFKNIVPIKLDSDFYLSTNSEFKSTQLLSMFQKLLNLIIIGALIASMRNFFRK